MIYQGSKLKLRKYIAPVLQDCIDRHGVTEYVEPFVGGANMIDHIRCEKRYGSDRLKVEISPCNKKTVWLCVDAGDNEH